jgi:hypothetical protein
MVKCASQASIGPSTTSSPKVPQEDPIDASIVDAQHPGLTPNNSSGYTNPTKASTNAHQLEIGQVFNQLCTANAAEC